MSSFLISFILMMNARIYIHSFADYRMNVLAMLYNIAVGLKLSVHIKF
jgi:hypothetical protein